MAYITVRQFIIKYSEEVKRDKPLSPRTVYRWIEEEKLSAKKDPCGHGWLIFMNSSSSILPD